MSSSSRQFLSIVEEFRWVFPIEVFGMERRYPSEFFLLDPSSREEKFSVSRSLARRNRFPLLGILFGQFHRREYSESESRKGEFYYIARSEEDFHVGTLGDVIFSPGTVS
jgi:hypothetical protein